MNKSKIAATSILIIVIACMMALITWELMQSQQYQQEVEPAPATPAASIEPTADTTDDDARLEAEITNLMLTLGIEDATDPSSQPIQETDVEALSQANSTQQAPTAGTYQATVLFEQGVEKDLAALEAAGRTITAQVDGAGNAILNFLGLEFEATYDDHYLYLDDGSKLAYYYDGQTITIAAHRVELDLVRAK